MHIVISCDKIFLLVSKYLSLWSWPSSELAIIGGIVFHKHILFFHVFMRGKQNWNIFAIFFFWCADFYMYITYVFLNVSLNYEITRFWQGNFIYECHAYFVHTKALLIIIRLVIRQLILNPVKIWSWSWSLWFVFFLTDCVFQHSPPVPCGVCHGLPTILQWGQQNPPLSQITTPVPPYGISTDISDLCDIDRIPPVLWNKSYDSWASSDWVHICWNLLLLCSLNLS